MKKTIIVLAAIAASFAFISCEQELLPSETGVRDGNRMVIVASTESGLTKTALSGNDTYGYDVVWNEGDVIMIGGNEYILSDGAGTTKGSFTGPALQSDANYYAWYAMSDQKIWTLPATQTYTAGKIANAPMHTYFQVRDGVPEPILLKNICGLVRITVMNDYAVKARNITVSADEAMCGNFSVANDKAYIFSDKGYSVTLDCGEEGVEITPAGTDFYISLPENSYNNFTIIITNTDGSKCVKKLKNGKTFDIKRAMIKPVTISAFFPPKDGLHGLFSISEDQQVVFSRGNLYYDGSSFQFEANQYDFRTYQKLGARIDGTFSKSGTPYKNWGQFGWSTSTTKYGMSTSGKSSNYSGDFVDWGTAVGDGKTWRTLTKAEWDYLLNKREMPGTGARYDNRFRDEGLVIDGVTYRGIILFPDGFSKQDTWRTEYTTWEQIDNAGLVFLPAYGYRYRDSITDPEYDGSYFTASSDAADRAYSLQFHRYLGFGEIDINHYERHFACFVRLAADATLPQAITIGSTVTHEGIEGTYIGNINGKKLIVATKNLGASTKYDKGTSFTRDDLRTLSIPSGWQLPTAGEMAVLAGLGLADDPSNDGAGESTYGTFIPYTQDVAGGLREGRIWVAGGGDDDFYWFRSDGKYGLTTEPTAKPNYYVRLVMKL